MKKTVEQVVEEIKTPSEDVKVLPVKRKKPIKKKVTPVPVTSPAREISDLEEVNAEEMSTEELVGYVTHLRTKLNVFDLANTRLDALAKSAFEKARNIELKLNNYQSITQQKMLYVQRAVSNLNDSLRLIGREEEN